MTTYSSNTKPHPKLQQIENMLNDGVSHREIARTLHVNTATINKWFPGTAWPPTWGPQLGQLNRWHGTKIGGIQ